ncbi:unnamed protein product, partial [Staurois parvus]
GVGVFRRTQGSLQGRHDGQSAAPHITGWIQSWEPTREMSPVLCPLYSRDSTQEAHTIPHHHQVDGSSHGNPPERCPHPLYSWDSTQEGHTIPPHHQSGNLRDYKTEVKQEIKEEDEDGEPTREMCLSSVFPGFHTGRSHHPSPSSGRWIQSWEPTRDVPVLCIPGIPHRKVTPFLTIIR